MIPRLEITLAHEAGRLSADIRPAMPLPLASLFSGRSPQAVAELLPRIFNLCPVAQDMASRMALGLPVGDTTPLAQEICREHLLKLSVIWPTLVGLPPALLPLGDAGAVRHALFGPAGMPGPAQIEGWLASGVGVAPLLNTIAGLFAPGEAVANLPLLAAQDVMTLAALDNSPAARQATHMTLSVIAFRYGKGPLWRAFARLVDLDACLDAPPAPVLLPDGTAVVPAARGTYGLRATVEAGLVTDLQRVTPTDHLIAPVGVLTLSLASLPAHKANLAPLLIAILDPCTPVKLREVQHA